MRHVLKLAAALVFAATAADAKVFEGGWTIGFQKGPDHVLAGSACYVFFNTGAVAGFPDSGNWRSNSGESGNFVYDNGVLRFYGTYNGGFDAITAYATITDFKSGVGGYSNWFTGSAPLTPIDDGTLEMGHGCAGG
ncbi:MAG TPA: hypothetical protein VFV07_06680 [Rhizomicrobium sp.]|nr:hypothetical protein [Rhizomicrobium sp.]